MSSSPLHSVPPPSHDEAPWPARLGTAMGAALGASAIAAGPAALRFAGDEPLGHTWIALVALTLPPMVLAVLVLRRARSALTAFGGEGAGARIAALFVWLGLFFAVLAVFGAVLRATTHHHALAGVTFATVALISGVALAPLSVRLSHLALGANEMGRRTRLVMLSIVAALPAFVLVHRARAAVPAASLALYVDLIAFAMTALFASRPALVARRRLAASGPLMALLALAIGGYDVVQSRPALSAIDERAPLVAPLADWLHR